MANAINRNLKKKQPNLQVQHSLFNSLVLWNTYVITGTCYGAQLIENLS